MKPSMGSVICGKAYSAFYVLFEVLQCISGCKGCYLTTLDKFRLAKRAGVDVLVLLNLDLGSYEWVDFLISVEPVGTVVATEGSSRLLRRGMLVLEAGPYDAT